MINAKLYNKEKCDRKRLSFQDDYGNRFGQKRELDGTILTMLWRFHVETPIRPKLFELCIKSQENERKKSQWCSHGAKNLRCIYRRKWKWNSRTMVMRIEQTRESRARRRCRSSSLTPDNPTTKYMHLKCSLLFFFNDKCWRCEKK